MKIRTDFVTNSSSSSFIIATKKDLKDVLEGITEKFSDNFFKIFVTKVKDTIIACSEEYSLEEIIKDLCSDEEEFSERYPEIYKGIKEKGFIKIYTGCFGDDDGISNFLCFTQLDYESDDIIYHSDGGY